MSLIITALFNKFKGWIFGAGALLIALATIYSKGRKDGKSKAIEDDRKELRKDVNDKRELENDVANDSDDDLDKRMRKWVKN